MHFRIERGGLVEASRGVGGAPLIVVPPPYRRP